MRQEVGRLSGRTTKIIQRKSDDSDSQKGSGMDGEQI